MKKTQTQQFLELEQKLDNYILSKTEEFKNKTVIYKRDWLTGKKSNGAEPWDIDEIHFSIHKNPHTERPHINKRASSEHINQLQEYFDELKQYGEIFFCTSKKDTIGKWSSGVWLSDIDNDYYAFSPDDLKDAIERHNKIYEDKYAPREGYVHCDYCHKQVPIDKVVKSTIFYRGRDNYGIMRSLKREGTFCSGQCAFNEQCACEG